MLFEVSVSFLRGMSKPVSPELMGRFVVQLDKADQRRGPCYQRQLQSILEASEAGREALWCPPEIRSG